MEGSIDVCPTNEWSGGLIFDVDISFVQSWMKFGIRQMNTGNKTELDLGLGPGSPGTGLGSSQLHFKITYQLDTESNLSGISWV